MAIARYDLGLTEAEFWDLTPAQFVALNKRHLIHRQMDDYRSGVIAAVMCNLHRSKDSPALQPSDFFSSLPEVKPKAMSGQQILDRCREITARFESLKDG